MADLVLELYVVGQSRNSMTAVDNLRAICAGQLAGRCRVQVIDLLEHPELAEASNIMATPTLIRRAPLPVRRIVGDLSTTQAVIDCLDLSEHEVTEAETPDHD
jgi:circadian clock protein KaiB